MKLPYICFYIQNFLAEIKGYSDLLGMAYLRAIGNYWATDCAGILDNEEHMRRVCEVFSDEEWTQVQPVVFGRFFTKDNAGVWQHREYKMQWEKASAKFDAQVSGGSKGGRKAAANRRLPSS